MQPNEISKVYELWSYWKNAREGDAVSQYNAGLALERHARISAHVDQARYLSLAYGMYLQSARQGNSDAQYKVGLFLLEGLCGEPDENSALEWFGKAYAQGHSEAPVRIAGIYGYSREGRYDFQACLGWIDKAREAGNTDACSHLALMYLNPDFKEYNREKGLQILRKEWLDSAVGSRTLGLMYQKGEGLDADWKAAMDCFNQGAHLEDPVCLYELALCYRNGTGVPAGDEQYINYMTTAAYCGHPDAMKRMMEHFLRFPDDSYKLGVAEDLCETALELGIGNYYHLMAACYENPQTAVYDYEKAAMAYDRADQTLPGVRYRRALYLMAYFIYYSSSYAAETALECLLDAAEGGLTHAHELIVYLYQENGLQDDGDAQYSPVQPVSRCGQAFQDLAQLLQRTAQVESDFSTAREWLEDYMAAAGTVQSAAYDAFLRKEKEYRFAFGTLENGYVLVTDGGKELTIKDYIGKVNDSFYVYDVTLAGKDRVYSLFELVPPASLGRMVSTGSEDVATDALDAKAAELSRAVRPYLNHPALPEEGYLHRYDLFRINNTLYLLCDRLLGLQSENSSETYTVLYEPLSAKRLSSGDNLPEPGAFSELETIDYGLDLCRLLLPLHQAGIAYGHLTPDNVLLSQGYDLYLPDFHVDTLVSGQPDHAQSPAPSKMEDDLRGMVSVLRFMRKSFESPLLEPVLSKVLYGQAPIRTLSELATALEALKTEVTSDSYKSVNVYGGNGAYNEHFDYHRALKLYLRAAEYGDADMYYWISNMLVPFSFDGIKDDALLERCLRKGMEGGSSICASRLADAYRCGLWSEQPDYVNMFACLNACTYEQDTTTLYMKGLCHEYGLGTGIDLDKARDCYEHSMSMEACIHLGYMYEYGKGVARDIQEAVEYYYNVKHNGLAYNRCVVNGRLDDMGYDEQDGYSEVAPDVFGYQGCKYQVPGYAKAACYTLKSFQLHCDGSSIHTRHPDSFTLCIKRHRRDLLSLFSDKNEWHCLHHPQWFKEIQFSTTLFLYRKGVGYPIASTSIKGYKGYGIHADANLISDALLSGEYFLYLPGATTEDEIPGAVQLDKGLLYPFNIRFQGQTENLPVLEQTVLTDTGNIRLQFSCPNVNGKDFSMEVICYDAGFRLVAEERKSWKGIQCLSDGILLEAEPSVTWVADASYQAVLCINRIPYAVLHFRVENGNLRSECQPLDERDNLYWFVSNWENGEDTRWKNTRSIPGSGYCHARLAHLYHQWLKIIRQESGRAKEWLVITAESLISARSIAASLVPFLSVGMDWVSPNDFNYDNDADFFETYGFYDSDDSLYVIYSAGEMVHPKFVKFREGLQNLHRHPDKSERVVLVDSKENMERMFRDCPEIAQMIPPENILDFTHQ